MTRARAQARAGLVLVLAGQHDATELALMIERLGIAVAAVDSPADAVAVVRARRPDVVIVDATSPIYDAHAAIGKLREVADGCLPIIAVSALGDADGRRLGLAAGADDLITRPLLEIELGLRLRAAVRLRRVTDELARASAELAAATISDPLTALHNTRAFATLLDREFARARRYQRAVSLLLVDIDGLRRINEVNGQAAGDQLLRDVADILRREIREPDVASRQDGTFRLLAPETTAESATAMGERLRRQIKQSTPTTVSVGIASFPTITVASASALLDLATAALRDAKAAGRNCCRSV